MVRTMLVLGLATVLCSCMTANQQSINRQFNPTDGDSRLIDAKQRAIISVKRNVLGADGRLVTLNGEPVTYLSVCAEPSPDALQATAATLAGSASRGGLEEVLKATFSTTEGVASIGLRTQTIQLLRDAYFRLCEAFLNDGLDSISYGILQRRFENQIIALLAVEQLTGVVKADQAMIHTLAASGASGETVDHIVEMIGSAQNELDMLEKEKANIDQKMSDIVADIEEKEKDKGAPSNETNTANEGTSSNGPNTANKGAPSNETNITNEGAPSNGANADEKKEIEEEIAEMNMEVKKLEVKKGILGRQMERRDEMIEQLIDALGKAVWPSVASEAASDGSFATRVNPTTASHTSEVVNAVRAITLNAINQDYAVQVCFETLRPRNNVSQFKNRTDKVFSEGSLTESVERSQSAESFDAYCDSLLMKHARSYGARNALIVAHADAVSEIISSIGKKKISADDAVKLITALSYAVPTEPGTAFLARNFNTSGESVAGNVKRQNNDQSEGAQLSAEVKDNPMCEADEEPDAQETECTHQRN